MSSGLRIWSWFKNLAWFSILYRNYVRLANRMLIRLLRVVANAGATIMVAVSSNCGSGWTTPVMLFVLVLSTTAFIVDVRCGSSVWFPSVRLCSGLGLQFFISSVIAIVISTWGKLIVPFAVSITAWWFLRKFNRLMKDDVFGSMTKVSVNVYVPILKWMAAVAMICSNWAFAHSILKGC